MAAPTTLFLAALLCAQGSTESRRTAPTCSVCGHDQALLQRAGLVSHGPMPFGTYDSAWIEANLLAPGWVFLETKHLRLAFGLSEAKVESAERARVDLNWIRLRAAFPALPESVQRLDRWQRAHLLALELEDFYQRFQRLLGVDDDAFPAERDMSGPFMGDGRFLGEKDKFEVVIHHTRSSHVEFCTALGTGAPTDSLRIHVPRLHKLLVSVPAEDADLRSTRWLLPHVVHNLSHALFCAYKHFSYDPPLWIDEGLALCMEKEIEPRSTTNEGEEGGKSDARGPSDFRAAARKLALSPKAPRLAELAAKKEFGEFDADDKVALWGMLRFLIEEHPDRLAEFLGRIKGQLDEDGIPSGLDLGGLVRSSMLELWKWKSEDFDRVWREWALGR